MRTSAARALSIILALGLCCAPAQALSHAKTLTHKQAKKLLLATPDANVARQAGSAIRLEHWDCPDQQKISPHYCRSLWAQGGSFTGDNGLIGYFAIDLNSGDVTDVNGAAVNNGRADTRAPRRR
jgi:hypothetical protein